MSLQVVFVFIEISVSKISAATSVQWRRTEFNILTATSFSRNGAPGTLDNRTEITLDSCHWYNFFDSLIENSLNENCFQKQRHILGETKSIQHGSAQYFNGNVVVTFCKTA